MVRSSFLILLFNFLLQANGVPVAGTGYTHCCQVAGAGYSPCCKNLQWYTEVGPDGVPREVQLTMAEVQRRLREQKTQGNIHTNYHGQTGPVKIEETPEEKEQRLELERLEKERLEQERRIKELEKKLAEEKKRSKPNVLTKSTRRRPNRTGMKRTLSSVPRRILRTNTRGSIYESQRERAAARARNDRPPSRSPEPPKKEEKKEKRKRPRGLIQRWIESKRRLMDKVKRRRVAG
ncbi:zinc finger CCCH domain-containing protein 18-like [Saccostrea cucullata]|uniref:zinc finger CCCH domain-containing protein 18-like n=1 Tax=Saccostrea cuccullata TaxID=36930 RepID=UPI002ED39776